MTKRKDNKQQSLKPLLKNCSKEQQKNDNANNVLMNIRGNKLEQKS
jgi:hypothetical protein